MEERLHVLRLLVRVVTLLFELVDVGSDAFLFDVALLGTEVGLLLQRGQPVVLGSGCGLLALLLLSIELSHGLIVGRLVPLASDIGQIRQHVALVLRLHQGSATPTVRTSLGQCSAV